MTVKPPTPGLRPPPDPTGTKPRPLRADARRNRDALIRAAGEAFARSGSAATLEEIARSAGVGIGTLYRHFPLRDDLVEAVYRREVDALCDSAALLLKDRPADAALEAWMLRFVDYVATKRGLAENLRGLMTADSTRLADIRDRIGAALGSLLRAAMADGAIRTDMSVEDVQLALSGIHVAPQGPEWKARAEQLVRLVLDGLRHR